MPYQSLSQLLAESEKLKQLSLADQKIKFDRNQILSRVAAYQQGFRNKGIRPCDRIALHLPRSIEAVIATYAVITFGCTYVPIDYKSPPQRKKFIIDDVQPVLIIDDEFVNLLTSSNTLEFHEVESNQLAAILYTSGSTGTPKGIALSHQAILFFVEWTFKQFDVNSSDIIGSLAPLHFDVSLFDLFVPWYADCQLLIIPDEVTSFPIELTHYLHQNKISIWYTVPSMLNYWSRKGAIKHLPALRKILFAGEVFPHQQLAVLMSLLPHTKFYNLYGPTETNVCTFWEVKNTNQALPIGIPVPGLSVAMSERETLLVSGPNLFSGYFSQGKLHPHQNKWFDTGDCVSKNVDGDFCYHGRLDRMVKIAGHRVELAEIEHALNNYEHILEAAVSTQSNNTGQNELIVYYVAKSDFDIKHCQRHLQRSLPYYMQPSRFHHLPKLPRLSNGKLDLIGLTKLADNP